MLSKQKHLELIQGIIDRLAVNSFALKRWSITLISALLALSVVHNRPAFGFIAFFPAIVFWILDGFFLRQERLYRVLYNHVRQKKEEDIDFSMNTKPFEEENKWLDAIFSKTLGLFYGVPIILVIIIMIYICMIAGG